MFMILIFEIRELVSTVRIFTFIVLQKKEIMADTGDEKQQKMEVDYSSTVDEKLPKCEKLAKVR